MSAGAAGGVRSICTRPFVPVQAEALPSASSDRNSTSVAPSAEIVAAAPAVGADQVLPPSAEVRYSYPAKPDPASAGVPVGWTVTEAAFAQAPEPPMSTGSAGGRVSTIASAVGSALAGAHAEALPALSSARNCTHVVPSAVTVRGCSCGRCAPRDARIPRAAVLVGGDAAAAGVGRAGRGERHRRRLSRRPCPR